MGRLNAIKRLDEDERKRIFLRFLKENNIFLKWAYERYKFVAGRNSYEIITTNHYKVDGCMFTISSLDNLWTLNLPDLFVYSFRYTNTKDGFAFWMKHKENYWRFIKDKYVNYR